MLALRTVKVTNQGLNFGPTIQAALYDGNINVISREWLRANNESNGSELIVAINNHPIRVRCNISKTPLPHGLELVISRHYFRGSSQALRATTGRTSLKAEESSSEHPRWGDVKQETVETVGTEPLYKRERLQFVDPQQIHMTKGAHLPTPEGPVATPLQISSYLKEHHRPANPKSQLDLETAFVLLYGRILTPPCLNYTLQSDDLRLILFWCEHSGSEKVPMTVENPYAYLRSMAGPSTTLPYKFDYMNFLNL